MQFPAVQDTVVAAVEVIVVPHVFAPTIDGGSPAEDGLAQVVPVALQVHPVGQVPLGVPGVPAVHVIPLATASAQSIPSGYP